MILGKRPTQIIYDEVTIMSRFELEEKIMATWSVEEDIKVLFRYVMEEPQLDRDEIANALLGMASVHSMKCSELFNMFEHMVNAGDIR